MSPNHCQLSAVPLTLHKISSNLEIWTPIFNPMSNVGELTKLTYRVIIKEGQKVNAYYTAKIYLLEASMVFILTTTYEHLFIYTKDLKFINLNVIGRQLYFLGKLADFSHFKPTLATWLSQKAF